jgi:hypothetical protein
MLAIRKKIVLVAVIALGLVLLTVAPAKAIIIEAAPVCSNPNGTWNIDVTNIYNDGGAYFRVCTNYGTEDEDCVDLGYLDWMDSAQATLPGDTCVDILMGQCEAAAPEGINLAAALNGCVPEYSPVDRYCSKEGWPSCPVSPTCDGGAGLYPPSNNGVPYNGYNDAGYFILAVDNHCDQPVEWVDVFTGDPLTEVMQVMSLPVGPNGWTQFSEDDIMNIRDTYEYDGEIWFRVRNIGDRYYGLHELMTHPNLGSAD